MDRLSTCPCSLLHTVRFRPWAACFPEVLQLGEDQRYARFLIALQPGGDASPLCAKYLHSDVTDAHVHTLEAAEVFTYATSQTDYVRPTLSAAAMTTTPSSLVVTQRN